MKLREGNREAIAFESLGWPVRGRRPDPSPSAHVGKRALVGGIESTMLM